jgi:hypothetical protein
MEFKYNPYKNRIAEDSELIDRKIKPIKSNGILVSKLISSSSFEFKDLRQYAAGDSVRHIHWKSTARTNEAMVKSFYEEQQKEIIFLVDQGIWMMSGIKTPCIQVALEILDDCKRYCSKNRIKNTWIKLYEEEPKKLEDTFSSILLKDSWNLDSTSFDQQINFKKKKNVLLFTNGDWIKDPNQNTKINNINFNNFTICWLPPIDTIPTEGIYLIDDITNNKQLEIDFNSLKTRNWINDKISSLKKITEEFCKNNKITFIDSTQKR